MLSANDDINVTASVIYQLNSVKFLLLILLKSMSFVSRETVYRRLMLSLIYSNSLKCNHRWI